MKKLLLILLPFSISLLTPLTAKDKEINAESFSKSIALISVSDSNNSATLPLDELRLFTEIFEQLKNHYVDPLSDQTLIQNAINGMLALDPHSKYYSKEAYQRIKNETTGTFAGIGIEATYNSDKSALIIQKILPNSPAYHANLKKGDIIQKIDGAPIKGIDTIKQEPSLQGKIGSTVILTILKNGQNIDLPLKREQIKIESLSKSKLYNAEFVYLKIDRFQEKSDEEIVNALMALELKAQTQNSKVRGMILDLRDNRGGLLTAAINVADLFLDEGLITYTEGQSSRFKAKYEAKKGDIIANIPLIVLINSQSASGSEIVAGALQDHQRALIVGENSYGKGSIQMIQPLKNGDAIRYTSARYYTPNGHSIQNDGITPDLILPHIDAKITHDSQSREIDNIGHLDNISNQQQHRMPADFTYLIEQGDFPLYEALNILKAMSHQ